MVFFLLAVLVGCWTELAGGFPHRRAGVGRTVVLTEFPPNASFLSCILQNDDQPARAWEDAGLIPDSSCE